MIIIAALLGVVLIIVIDLTVAIEIYWLWLVTRIMCIGGPMLAAAWFEWPLYAQIVHGVLDPGSRVHY